MLETSGVPLLGAEGSLLGYRGIDRDVTLRDAENARLHDIARRDDLTQLGNRLALRERLIAILDGAGQGAGPRAGQGAGQAGGQGGGEARGHLVLLLDLDLFKAVNDTLGHKAGDELLRMTGARMASCLRREDTVGRFGGDEFVLVLNEVGDDPAVLGPLFDKIRTRVNEVILLEGQLAHVGCSMGVAMYPRDGLDADALMRHADAAMYHAKKSGKNRYQFYTRDMDLPEHV